MRLLLDTHAFAWWVFGDRRLTKAARDAIEIDENKVFISAVSIYEIVRKHALGKWRDVETIAQDVAAEVRYQGFTELSVTVAHAQAAGELPAPHRDPFDRILIAQALAEKLTIVSNERAFDGYGVPRLW